jgi:ATP-dependent Clp protease ATP-binding subunit ClpA
MKLLHDHFRPEFLNRIDGIQIFHPLTRKDLIGILDVQLKLFSGRLADQGISLKISSSAKTFLADKGYDPGFGARPLKRVIVNELENPVSRKIVSGELHDGMTLAIDRQGDGLAFAAEERSVKS